MSDRCLGHACPTCYRDEARASGTAAQVEALHRAVVETAPSQAGLSYLVQLDQVAGLGKSTLLPLSGVPSIPQPARLLNPKQMQQEVRDVVDP